MIARVALFLVLLAAGASAIPPAPAAAARGGLEGAAISPAARTVGECVRRTNSLLVDVQIDRSASLRSTDPDDRRIDGISAALLQLGHMAEQEGRDEPAPRVEVLLSSFAGSALPEAPERVWREVDPSSSDSLVSQAERYGARDNGRDTDYVLAFASARDALNSRAAELAADEGVRPCKAILFLSDGRFHLGDRSDSSVLPQTVPYAPGVDLAAPGGPHRAVLAGQRFLCRPGGLMDRIVEDGIVTFTVALSASPRFRPADRAFLEAVTNGGPGGSECGSTLSRRTGEFTEVTDTSQLYFAFDPDGRGGGGPCDPCPNPSQFVAIPGLSGFRLSASTPLEGVEALLRDPTGQSRTLTSTGPTDLEAAGTALEQQWVRSRAFELEARFDRDSEAWQGVWRFLFFDPESAATPVPVYELSLRSGLRPEIVADPELVRGARVPVAVRLVDPRGEPVGGGRLVELAQLRAEVRDATGAKRRLPVTETGPGRFRVTVDVPSDAADGKWTLETELEYPDSTTPIERRFDSLPLGAAQSLPEMPLWQGMAIVAALLLALALLALALLQRRRREAAKFTAPQLLRGFQCDAAARAGAVELSPDPIELRYDDFEPVKRDGRDAKASRFHYAPFAFRARLPRRLRVRPEGEVTAGGAQLLGGRADGPLRASEKRTVLQVPLELAGTWLFAIESIDEEGAVRGRLAVLTDVDAPSGLGDRTLAEARAALAAQDWEGFERSSGREGADPGPADEPLPLDVDDIDWGVI